LVAHSKGDTSKLFLQTTHDDRLVVLCGDTKYFVNAFDSEKKSDSQWFDANNFDALPPEQQQHVLDTLLKSRRDTANAPLTAFDLGRYFFDDSSPEAEPDQQLFTGLLARGDFCVWLGREKHRKSNLILQLAILAALGRDFLGFRFAAEPPLKVTLIDFESKGNSLKQRYAGIVAALNLSEPEQKQLRENLRILGVRKIRRAGHIFPKFPAPTKNNKQDPDLKFWEDFVALNPTDLYIIDPMRMLHASDENDSLIEGLLTEVSRVFCGAAVVLCHHMRKQQGEKAVSLVEDMRTWSDGGRGSSAIKAHADVIVLQERSENDKGEEIVHIGAYLKDGADIEPFPTMESDHLSFFWQVVVSMPEKLKPAYEALTGGTYQNKGKAAEQIQKSTGVSRSTGWRWLEELVRLKLVSEGQDGKIVAKGGVF
jgi:hypothetical protein